MREYLSHKSMNDECEENCIKRIHNSFISYSWIATFLTVIFTGIFYLTPMNTIFIEEFDR